jgi:hypothetical protein
MTDNIDKLNRVIEEVKKSKKYFLICCSDDEENAKLTSAVIGHNYTKSSLLGTLVILMQEIVKEKKSKV